MKALWVVMAVVVLGGVIDVCNLLRLRRKLKQRLHWIKEHRQGRMG